MKECEYCLTKFTPVTACQRFCSATCRNRAYKKVKIYDKECSHCGSIFEGNKQRRFCKSCIDNVSEHERRSSTAHGRLARLCQMAKNRAKNKKIDFNLTPDYLLHLWESQLGKCAVSGRNFILEPSKKFRQVHPDAPSIDRIIPKNGYIEGNVRLITYHSNVCVNEYGDKVLIDLIRDIMANKEK